MLGASGVGLGQRRGSDTLWLGSVGYIDEGFQSYAVALDTLDRLLGEHARAGAELSVVISGHFSRFCLVPWSAQISSPEELRGFAQLCFEDLFGAPTQPWSLVLSAEPAGYDRIASALPQELLERLRVLVSGRGLRLRSVQPYLMAAFNRFDKASMPATSCLSSPSRNAACCCSQGKGAGPVCAQWAAATAMPR